MEIYLKSLPFFVFAVSLGIIGSLLFGKKSEFSRMRILREVFGGFWISAIGYFLLDQLTDLSDITLFAICSITAYVNSKIINIIGEDLMIAIGKGLARLVRNIADRFKKDDSGFDDSDDIDWDVDNKKTEE